MVCPLAFLEPTKEPIKFWLYRMRQLHGDYTISIKRTSGQIKEYPNRRKPSVSKKNTGLSNFSLSNDLRKISLELVQLE
jgi:hypothetical protein